MITAETTQAFFGDAEESKDPNYLLKQMAELAEDEPQFLAFLTVVFANVNTINNPVTAACMAVTMYLKMRASQDEADKLSGEMG